MTRSAKNGRRRMALNLTTCASPSAPPAISAFFHEGSLTKRKSVKNASATVAAIPRSVVTKWSCPRIFGESV